MCTENSFFYAHRRFSLMGISKCLDALVAGGFLEKKKIGRSNYYINLALSRILQG